MAVEVRNSKCLYKIELYLLRILPMIIAILYLMNAVLSYYDIDFIIFSYLGGMSILPMIFLYVSSYVFKFCEYHRMFLHYIVLNDLITQIDYHIGIDVSDRGLLSLHLIVAGICLFVILYLYVGSNKKSSSKNSK